MRYPPIPRRSNRASCSPNGSPTRCSIGVSPISRCPTTTRAIDDYTAALRIDALGAKLRAIALYNRGLAYQKSKQPALAIEDFTSALFLDPEFAHAYYSRANVLRESGQYLFALSDYEKALRFNHPQPYLVYYGEALTQKRCSVRWRRRKRSRWRLPPIRPSHRRGEACSPGPWRPSVAENLSPPPDRSTGSITGLGPDQVVRKEILPAAVEPPAELGGNALVQSVSAAGRPEKPGKIFSDRVPEDEWASAERVEVSEAQEPARAVEPVTQKLPKFRRSRPSSRSQRRERWR